MKNIPILLLSTNILSVTPFCTLLEESVVRIENSWNNACIKTIRNYFNPLCTVCQLEPNAQYSKTRISKVDRYYLKVKHQITAIILSRIKIQTEFIKGLEYQFPTFTSSQPKASKIFRGKKSGLFLAALSRTFLKL